VRGIRSRKILAAALLNGLFDHPHLEHSLVITAMNKDEAKAILSDQLKSFTTRSYSELAAFIDKPVGV
jgi:hypothetical protein